MNPEKALKLLSKRADEAEIFFSREVHRKVETKKCEIDVYKENVSSGYGIRVLKDKKMGFAFANKLSEEILEKAVKISCVAERDEFLSLPEKQRYKKAGDFDKRILEVEAKEIKEFVGSLLSPCEEYKVQPTSGGISWSTIEMEIWNTRGLHGADRGTSCSCFLSTVAKNGRASTGFHYAVSRRLNLDFEVVGREAARLAKESLAAQKIETMTTSVTLKPLAVSELLENVLLPAFSADSVQRNRSPLGGKQGEKIFSEAIEIIDDGTLKHGLATTSFDAEGVRSQKTALVKNGVLRGYLFDTYTANKGRTKSTGNAERSSYSSLPQIGASNFIITGKGKLAERGLVVHGLIGAHTSNPISGDFSVETRNAFLNGKPVKKAIISGNIYQLLNSVEGFGKDVTQVSAVSSPSISFKDVRVIG